MDRIKIAQELVAIARELNRKARKVEARRSGSIKQFIRDNEEPMGQYGESAKMKLMGPNTDSNWLDVSLDSLRQMAKHYYAKELTAEEDVNELKGKLPRMKLYEIADLIIRDWRPVNYAAKPYLQAMREMQSVNDNYGYDSGKSIVLYFLTNAGKWRGPLAKLVKAELKKRTK